MKWTDETFIKNYFIIYNYLSYIPGLDVTFGNVNQ